MDRGEYNWVRELSMANIDRIDAKEFTLSRIQGAHEIARTDRYLRRLKAVDRQPNLD